VAFRGNLSFENLSFRRVSAGTGSIHVSSTANGLVTLYDCIFEESIYENRGCFTAEALNGSAFLILNLTKSQFQSCFVSASGGTGVISSEQKIVRISDCVFENCTVGGSGQLGCFFWNCAASSGILDVSVIGCIFENEKFGGGTCSALFIRAYSDKDEGLFLMRNSTFHWQCPTAILDSAPIENVDVPFSVFECSKISVSSQLASASAICQVTNTVTVRIDECVVESFGSLWDERVGVNVQGTATTIHNSSFLSLRTGILMLSSHVLTVTYCEFISFGDSAILAPGFGDGCNVSVNASYFGERGNGTSAAFIAISGAFSQVRIDFSCFQGVHPQRFTVLSYLTKVTLGSQNCFSNKKEKAIYPAESVIQDDTGCGTSHYECVYCNLTCPTARFSMSSHFTTSDSFSLTDVYSDTYLFGSTKILDPSSNLECSEQQMTTDGINWSEVMEVTSLMTQIDFFSQSEFISTGNSRENDLVLESYQFSRGSLDDTASSGLRSPLHSWSNEVSTKSEWNSSLNDIAPSESGTKEIGSSLDYSSNEVYTESEWSDSITEINSNSLTDNVSAEAAVKESFLFKTLSAGYISSIALLFVVGLVLYFRSLVLEEKIYDITLLL
jgi:hypothetical protein